MESKPYRQSPRDFRDVHVRPSDLPWHELLGVLRNAGFFVLQWGEVPPWFKEGVTKDWYKNMGGTQERLPL